jgi:hypothetical protein
MKKGSGISFSSREREQEKVTGIINAFRFLRPLASINYTVIVDNFLQISVPFVSPKFLSMHDSSTETERRLEICWSRVRERGYRLNGLR